jgi:hypothetical protein
LRVREDDMWYFTIRDRGRGAGGPPPSLKFIKNKKEKKKVKKKKIAYWPLLKKKFSH